MRIINQYNVTITEYDLTKGKLINGKTKNDNGVFEEVQIYLPNKSIHDKPHKMSISAKIKKLKAQLAATDYKVIKCSECALAGEPAPYDIKELHAERQAIRDQINELEKEV